MMWVKEAIGERHLRLTRSSLLCSAGSLRGPRKIYAACVH